MRAKKGSILFTNGTSMFLRSLYFKIACELLWFCSGGFLNQQNFNWHIWLDLTGTVKNSDKKESISNTCFLIQHVLLGLKSLSFLNGIVLSWNRTCVKLDLKIQWHLDEYLGGEFRTLFFEISQGIIHLVCTQKFPEKLSFFSPWYVPGVRISGEELLVFQKILRVH